MPLADNDFRRLGGLTDKQESTWRRVAEKWALHLDAYINEHGQFDPEPYSYNEESLVGQVAVGVARASEKHVLMLEYKTYEPRPNSSADGWMVLSGERYLVEAKRYELGWRSGQGWFDGVPAAVRSAFKQADRYNQSAKWNAAFVFMVPRIPETDTVSRKTVFESVRDETVSIGAGLRGFRVDYYPSILPDTSSKPEVRYPGITWITVLRRA